MGGADLEEKLPEDVLRQHQLLLRWSRKSENLCARVSVEEEMEEEKEEKEEEELQ